VVGNRGLGAAEGHELGSVPSEVVHRSTSDVLIVQVPENAESEYT
jgi:nucleotide-binding universal stress UspA family protein